ncbi:MAG TPA: SpoIIE family protein phosphatase [Acidobacteriaceae bacterium]|nr:SpoIIE family protein phosphatase [Acidobacteriaceae bacterium]
MDKAQPTNAKLIMESGGMRRIVTLAPLPFTLGRGADRDLMLSHPQVSRNHASIDRDGDGFFLTDNGSRHGTFTNGMPVTTTRLRNGDRITLGTSQDMLLFEETEEDISTRSLLKSLSLSGSESDLETLSLFLKAAQSLNQRGALEDVLCTMLGYVIRLTSAERGFVFLGGSPEDFELACGLDKAGKAITESGDISHSIVRDAANSQLDFVLSDTAGEAAKGRHSLVLHSIRSVAAIPLRGRSTAPLLGLLYLDSRSGPQDFTRIGKDILHAIASQAATLLENFRMIEAERESVLLRQELEIAASIQRQMIPQTLPVIPGISIDARTVPCTSVGGDFYDVIPRPDGFVAIVGDVCGKGIPAALLASMVQGMFHAQITTGASLLDAVQSVNGFVCLRAPGEKYLTLVVLRSTRGADGGISVELVNGGHVSPLIVRADGAVETLSDGDLPVGLIEAATYHALHVTLAEGDRIVLLSDGISEAESPDGTQFGQTELAVHLAGTKTVAELFEALDGFCEGAAAADDQTIMTVQRTA